jgi:hypothetical protein
MLKASRANWPAVLALGIALTLTATLSHAKTEFLTYDGRNSVQQGDGGNKKVVGGIEFWIDGTPPHRYQILGEIVDERWKSGLLGMIQMGNFEKDIAKLAKAAGGDAVLLADEHDNVVGVMGTSFGSASGNGYSAFGSASSFASPLTRQASRFIVVRYLPDPPPSPAAAQPPAAPPPPPYAPPPPPEAQPLPPASPAPN